MQKKNNYNNSKNPTYLGPFDTKSIIKGLGTVFRHFYTSDILLHWCGHVKKSARLVGYGKDKHKLLFLSDISLTGIISECHNKSTIIICLLIFFFFFFLIIDFFSGVFV